ncbi:MAG: methyl-accepting chemotaxis protein [Halobacteria archaeon]|nr:methyl-accepting chemotaxis protein [Halobacteria archaeon]
MLSKLKIGSRLLMLIAVQTIVVVVIGLTSIVGANYAAQTTESLNRNVIEQVTLNQINEAVRSDLLEMINRVLIGKTDWSEGESNLISAKSLFINNWDEYKEDKDALEVQEIEASLENDYRNVVLAFSDLGVIFQRKDLTALNNYIEFKIPALVNPFLLELNERVNEQQLLSEAQFEDTIETNKMFLYGSIAIILAGLLVAGLLGYLILRSITKPIKKISDTVGKVSEGDYYARTDIHGRDELSELGQAFDGLLKDKVSTLVQAEKENELLNQSVISLLQAVSKLSRRDLTIKVPVTEDVTGPVADALNQLTTETSRVLHGVRRISEEVAQASAVVKSQAEVVIAVANDERKEVEETAQALASAANAMNAISELARTCNTAAENAINTTHTALTTVTSTVNGINSIRENVHETEKRIKRLGERSQEISRAVNLINSISERTHILALNASMHAASAGEAGRGFAVVADEVQRLAENARDATSQIATLVSNIQVETADTVGTMNKVITQVVEGTKLAEEAGVQMERTKDSTEELVESVKEIARSSVDQARITNVLKGRAEQIKESTQKTSKQLQEQNVQTARLVEFAKGLLKAVQVFRLPISETAATPDNKEVDEQGQPVVSMGDVGQKLAS